MDKLPFFLLMLALAVGIFAMLAVGWRNRLRRQSDVDPLPEIPACAGRRAGSRGRPVRRLHHRR